jgi:hypothetical protein
MRNSSFKESMFAYLIIINVTLMIMLFGVAPSELNISRATINVILIFQLINSIYFIIILSKFVRMANESVNSFLKAEEQSLIDLNIKKIVLQLIIEEVKPDSLNNVDEIHIKELIHEAKRRVQEKYVNQLKLDENI